MVIGILAAITVMSYGAITNNAKQKGVEADAMSMASILTKYRADHGAYPSDLSVITANAQFKSTYQYTYDAMAHTYCLTAGATGVSAYIASGSSATTKGACPGHGINGEAPIENLAKNPRGIGASAQYASSGWFDTICGTNAVDVSGISWNSKTNWHRMYWTGSGCNTMRMNLDLSDLQNGMTYTVSALAGNNGASVTTFTMDLADQGQTSYSLNPGEMRRVSFSASRSVYDTTYRFLDINPIVAGNGVLINEVMITQGTANYNFADGSSTNWVWNGTANSSTSTGPAL